ncbi:MAG: DNA mismatch endonuclease Vsr [Armatimonadetes bacterium]|nr:DNA mismatch endonuclease Vsr [Armatimonadota bacterium]
MSRVKGKDTVPEKVVRSLLHNLGYRFRLHRKDLPGSPDMVLPKYNTAIFVHGCFWHRHKGCPKTTMPTANYEYWEKKFSENIDRDTRKERELRQLGWRIIIVWQCETATKRLGLLADRLKAELKLEQVSRNTEQSSNLKPIT